MTELAWQAPHTDERWGSLERRFFGLAALVAGCPEHAQALMELQARLRRVVKTQSRRWGVTDPAARRRVYRLLYGSRAALEEVLLQMPSDDMPVLSRGVDEPSEAPSTEIHGVRVHSGDILVSRGGAPTSALIARGNDFPGNFSHVALVHVNEDGEFETIEAHIERGVVVAPLETYERDTKLRVMLLRPRRDLPAVGRDPRVAHRVAEAAVANTRRRHIPYDFAMNYEDPAEQFCSEVASANYREAGVELWEGLTTMSTPGLARWLSAFGVRNFTTHGPSDLEYDPQLVVVAEWRNAEALLQDHMDAAILDVMLEEAAEGAEVQYAHAMLPIARLLKGFSMVQNLFGAEGRIPEGMSATTGLRVQWLDATHAARRQSLREAMTAYEAEHGHRPHYPDMVRLAREAR